MQNENIIQYKYFIHRHDGDRKFECHTILEMLTGKDMNVYIRNFPPKSRNQDVLA